MAGRIHTIRQLRPKPRLLLQLLLPVLLAGCAVPQGPGKGKRLHLREPASGRSYWLYLPRQCPTDAMDCPGDRLWPLVVSLHGMKPFDNYSSQMNEWQQQADAYGFIVCAPNLRTSDLMMEIPLKHVHPYVRDDEKAVLAILDQVFRTTDADPNNVLITSWSSGGYMAHYLLNRHPDRFSCLAVRQSNFSSSILRPETVHRYRATPIAIFFGQNDLAICRTESREAVAWYRDHGFVVEAFSVEGLGHERTPQTAADYFARVCGRQPLDRALAQQALARVRIQPVLTTPNGAANVSRRSGDRSGSQQAHQQLALAQVTADSPKPLNTATRTPPSSAAREAQNGSAVRIKLSSPGGIAPVYLRFQLELVRPLRGNLDCLWLHNGVPISSGMEGTRILRKAGQHTIEAIVTTPGREFRVRRSVVVQLKVPSGPR